MTNLTEVQLLRRRFRRLGNIPTKNTNKINTMEIDGVIFVKKRARVIPFGYKISEQYKGWLEPVPLEIAALARAKDYVKSGCNYTEVAAWVSKVSSRVLSTMGLHKAIRRGY